MSERDIFITALEKKDDPAALAAYLDTVCSGNAALRTRIERLLRLHSEAGSFLEQPAEDGAVEALTTVSRMAVGTRLGPYKLLQKLGEGGMGVVWVAEQQEPVKRRVALKVIKPGMDSAQVVRRFEAEQQALALMDHGNIAKVFDAGTTVEGRPYFVMELVKGVPITRYCDELRLPLRERLALFVPVCQAVQHAHQKGIIHRDLKPSNVLVCIQDGQPVPKIIDFGVAKALHRPLTENSLYTEIGAVIGTLEYMSPEQAELSALDIDTRADVYALGVLLYELLTGTTPLDRQRLRDAGFGEMLRIIKEEEPPRPSTRLLARSGDGAATRVIVSRPETSARELRGELDWIVMKCLEKDRSRRYDTASGLARDLEHYLHDEQVEACPPGAGYRLRKMVRRHRAALLTAAACIVLLLSGVVASTWQAVRATRAEAIAQEETATALKERDAKELALATSEKQRVRAEKAEALANGQKQRADKEARIARAVNDFLQQDLLRQADSGAQADRGFAADPNLTMKEALNRAAARIGDRFRQEPLVEAAIRLAIGEAYRGLGAPRLGVPHLEQARALRQAALGADHPDTLTAANSLAHAYHDAGEVKRSLPLFEQTLAQFQKTLGPDHPSTLTTMYYLAGEYHSTGQLAKALPLYEQSLAKETQKYGPDHTSTLASMHNLARAYQSAGQLDKALPLARQTFTKFRDNLGPDHPNTLAAMTTLASVYRDAGQMHKALPLYEQALLKEAHTLGSGHPRTLVTTYQLAGVYREIGLPAKAVAMLEPALAKQQEVLGADHPNTLASMSGLALAYEASRQLDRAVPLFEQTLTKFREKFGPDHPSTLASMHNLARAYQGAGQMDKALPLFQQTLAREKDKLGPDHPTTLACMNNLAEAYHAARQPAEAETLLRECLSRRTRKTPTNWLTWQTRLQLACALLVQQKNAEAETLLRQCCEDLSKHLSPVPLNSRKLLTQALTRLVDLHELNGQTAEAASWRTLRDEAEKVPQASRNFNPPPSRSHPQN
jgi:serine/threonine protein kinase